MPSAPATTDIVLERLSKLHPKLIDLSLERVCRLLDALDNPERRLPPVVHVAGTNGKGSVIAYLRAMLEAAGRRVHVYTSPHLVRFHERIRLGGRLIEEPHLLDLLEECERANGPAPITFFEVTTCAAFLAFARVPADILLLEVGLGGEFDATNVIDRPRLCVLTPISFDHMQHLGNTLTAIAGVKAGIMKRGVSAVVGPQLPEPLAVFEARAAALNCALSRHGREWAAWRDGERMAFRDAGGERQLPLPALIGAHQIDNAEPRSLVCLIWQTSASTKTQRIAVSSTSSGRRACSACGVARWLICCRPAGNYGSTAVTTPTAVASRPLSRRPGRANSRLSPCI